jgi:hypothetical protein
MMRITLSLLLAVHGLLHLLGFAKACGLAQLPQMTGRTLTALSAPATTALGLAWLAASLLLLAAAVLCAGHVDIGWLPAAVGLGVSQTLIVLQWPDAKAGTWVNLLLLVPIVAAAAIARFHAGNAQHEKALFAAASAQTEVVTEADLAFLPAPVRHWLQSAGVVGKPRARTVKLWQQGQMRTRLAGAWMPTVASQSFSVNPPGFVWGADVTMFYLLPVVARDTSEQGRGRMWIKALGLVTLADGTGVAFDQGSLVRWLGETVWFPLAALSPAITWKPLDSRHAEATISFGAVTAPMVFAFDDQGRVVGLTARRSYDGGSMQDWLISLTEWRTVRGVEIPTRGSVSWALPAGILEYFRVSVLDVETNQGPIKP